MEKLTYQDKKNGFIAAVTRFENAKKRWKAYAKTGLSDEALVCALKHEIGIAGGSSGTGGRPNISYEGSGLKIWVSWKFPNPYRDDPVFEGAHTMKMAREIFGVRNPDENQLSLF